MKKLLLLTFLLSPLVLFAEGSTETDIVPRTVNFLIFAGIVYYLLGDKIKSFLADRSSSIQNELDKVQAKLDESKQRMINAEVELADAKRIANDLIDEANSSVVMIEKRISEAFDAEIIQLNNSFEDKIALEAKKAKENVVREVLNQLLINDNLAISKEELAQVISRKVA